MSQHLAEPFARLLAAASARGPRAGGTHVLAIDGQSGAGKTTMGHALVAHLDAQGREAPLVHLDHIYPGWEGLADTPARVVDWLLRPLAEGRPAGYSRYDWVADRYAEWHPVATSDWLVIEGSGSAADACAPYLAGVLWVEAPHDLRYERAMARDGEGYRPYWRRWADQEERYRLEQGARDRADVVLDTR